MTSCTACGDAHPADNTACPRTGQSLLGGPCGTRIARYEVERLLGDGGMGAVYRARHVMLNQPVAVKLLHPEFARRGDMIERFLREARAAAAIGNPHIIRVHDCDVTADGRPFLVMELLDGEGLDALLRRERRLPPQRAVALAQQMLDGLGAAHAAGIIHRDMKPANVFVRQTPDPAVPEFVTVLDFGISKIADPSGSQQNITQTGAVIGTPIYMAPEQIMSPKEVDRRVDIYATGVMVYEMLSGRLPYEGSNTAELIVKACTVPPTPLRDVAPDLPAAIVDVVDRAMAREPSARWQSAAEFADALRRSLGGGHAFPTAPQGSGPNGWAPANPVGTPVTALPSTSATPLTAFPATSAAPLTAFPAMAAAPPLPSMATPSHWGALAAPAPAAFAPPQPPRRARTALVVGGVIAALAGLCCMGSLAAGYFATSQPDPAPEEPPGPRMTPLPTPAQEIVPTEHPPAQAPQMVPMNAPASPTAPMPPGVFVTVDEPQVVGLMAPDAVQRALTAATPAMDRCRIATAQTVTVLAIVQANGRVVINRPADDNAGDPSVAQCVGNRFASQQVDAAGSGGIVTFTAHLAPR